MKKIIFPTIFIAILFLSACTTTPQGATLEVSEKVGKDNLIRSDETFRMELSVKNPTANTFVGNLTYTFNSKCLNIDLPYVYSSSSSDIKTYKENIEVAPQGKQGVIRILTPTGTADRYPKPLPECLNLPLEISVTLYDRSGLIKDSHQTKLAILPS